MDAILDFLASNKGAIGAIVGIFEGIVVIINMWRKFRAKTKGGAEVMSASTSKIKGFLWAINPVNVIRKSK